MFKTDKEKITEEPDKQMHKNIAKIGEALIKKIKWPLEPTPGLYQSGREDGITHAMGMIQDFFANDLAQQIREYYSWIPVSEGLPTDPLEDCVLMIVGTPQEGFYRYEKEKWWRWDSAKQEIEYYSLSPTHYFPISRIGGGG